jgi:large subunit ribosomal protein L3
MGNVRRTAQGLEVVQIDAERDLIAVKGAVPGSKGGRLILKPTIKVSAKSSK